MGKWPDYSVCTICTCIWTPTTGGPESRIRFCRGPPLPEARAHKLRSQNSYRKFHQKDRAMVRLAESYPGDLDNSVLPDEMIHLRLLNKQKALGTNYRVTLHSCCICIWAYILNSCKIAYFTECFHCPADIHVYNGVIKLH